ncbi:hypothetical protein ONZ43_g7778 [Nemania bipapillata]|uniref:Uncharacterized protein n=1 Tax=Nemania bipapillata TaxID=110536 RepID=A0ACC2HND5_9PEZI|nr:hypothetical protein ONZ43_g7778 [Nemania bipapillata]
MYSLRSLPLLATITHFLSATATATATMRPRTAEDNDDTPLPVVIWHGLGDTYAAEGIQQVGQLVEAAHPGTFVYFVRLDDNAGNDQRATFYGNVTEQVAQVCAALAAHPILSCAPTSSAATRRPCATC